MSDRNTGFALRVILLSGLMGAPLTPDNILSDKIRKVKSSYPFGNFVGHTVEVKAGGERQTVRFLPDTAYAHDNAPFVMLKRDESGKWAVYRDTPEDISLMYHLWPLDYEYMYQRSRVDEAAPPRGLPAVDVLTNRMLIQMAAQNIRTEHHKHFLAREARRK